MLFFESDELGRTEEFLSAHYAPMRVAAVGEHARLQVSRAEADGASVDRLDVGFELAYDATPVGRICLCDVESGTIEDHLPAGVDQRAYGPGDFFSFSVPDRPCRGRINRARYTITMFDPDVLGQVAGPTGSGAAHVLLDHRPAGPADAARLRVAINHFDRYVLADPAVHERPLVVAAATQYIATLLLHTFPSTADLWPGTTDSRDARSATVRRAIAYIEAHAGTPISPADIAAASHVSVRALQLAFRRHLDTTPTAYLRQVRLEGARRDLVDGEAEGGATVAAIAARWGFAHQGRFGIAYRTAYGETPGSTLRGAEPVDASNGQGSSPYG